MFIASSIAVKLLLCSSSIQQCDHVTTTYQSTDIAMELNDVPEYQTIKKVLRAILISGCDKGMSQHDLCAQYRDIEGHSIPYEEFGFSTVDNCLMTMKDTVRWVRFQLLNVPTSPACLCFYL